MSSTSKDTLVEVLVLSLSSAVILILLLLAVFKDRCCYSIRRRRQRSHRTQHTDVEMQQHYRHRIPGTCDADDEIWFEEDGVYGEDVSQSPYSQTPYSQSPYLQSPYGEYKQYGGLFVPPDRRPTDVAIDIITRRVLAVGLSSATMYRLVPAAASTTAAESDGFVETEVYGVGVTSQEAALQEVLERQREDGKLANNMAALKLETNERSSNEEHLRVGEKMARMYR